MNDVNVAYPGGYIYLFWGQSFRSTFTGETGTGTYGYYHVNDLGDARRRARQHPEPLRAGHLAGRLTSHAEPGPPHGEREDPDLQARHRAVRLSVRVRRQAGASPRRDLRRARRRPGQGLRELGTLLRLDEVRDRARLVRRRRLAHLLPFARHARHRQPEPEQHAGPRSVGQPDGFPRPARHGDPQHRSRTSSRCIRTASTAAWTISSVGPWRSVSTSSTTTWAARSRTWARS